MTGKEDESEQLVQDFWQQSVAAYGDDAFKSELLRLQDEYGANVNCCLFALWLTTSCQLRLDRECADLLVAKARRTQDWTEKLRQLRREIETVNTTDMPEIARQGRQSMLDAEIKIEQLHQQKLVSAMVHYPQPLPTLSGVTESAVLDNLRSMTGGKIPDQEFATIVDYWMKFSCAG